MAVAYRALADAVVALHLGFVLFAALGGLLVWRRRGLALAHLPAVAWAALVEWMGLECPLSGLESWLRARAGEAGHASGFVEHYLLPVLYPAALTRELQIELGVLLVAINAAIYAWMLPALVRGWRSRSGRT